MTPAHIYQVTDPTGASSIHLAVSGDAAVQGHMICHGLLSCQEPIKIEDLGLLRDWKRPRSDICWDPGCMLACMSGLSEQERLLERSRDWLDNGQASPL